MPPRRSGSARWRCGLALSAALLVLSGCAPASAPGRTLTVFAAASLSDVFQEAGTAFSEANPGVTVEFNFAPSDQLAQQILAGSPADVFAGANTTQMQVVVDGGMAAADTVRVFVHNQLVIVTPADNPAGISALDDLAQPGLRLILAAAEVPAGKYAIQLLENASADDALGADFGPAVQANVASYEENVRAVLTKVTLGEADAGIVYRTDALSAGGDVVTVVIPAEWNVIADYPIAPVTGSDTADTAQAFIDYLLSPDGQALLSEYGFVPVSP